MVEQPSGTVTLVFTDIEGSTRLLDELGTEHYRRALAQHRSAVRDAFARYHGYEVDFEGDAFFYAFQSASAAAGAAREALAALAGGPISVRVGVHTGEPSLDPPKYVGMDVHRAARIMAVAHGGQVVLSQSAHDLLEDRDEHRDLGEHRLKDIAAPVRLYQLGDGEFPPLKSLYQTTMPVPATPFLGRQSELRDVAALLERDDVSLVTLTGPGGTGKTRLALQAAAEAAEEFPDGLTWVALSPLRDPGLLLAAVAQALDVDEQPGRPLAATLAAHLSGRRRLLILDNAEHLLPQAAGDIARLREVVGLTVLVTSRERLQIQGEHVWAVPPLTDDDGASLFTARAHALAPTFVASPAVNELCTRLDNLPLALELAAARTPLFTPEQLLQRLSQRLDLLTAGRDADPRQQTLRATIAWSHDLLGEGEQRLFRRLAAFVGGCTYEAAEALCGADPDTLQSLLDKSLLRRRDTELGPRYWMLETIREFAAERQHESGEAEDLAQRHADHFLQVAEETEPALHGSEQTACLDRLDAEHDNLRAALRASPPELRLRLAAALGWFWQLRSYLAEGLGWLDQALLEVNAPTRDRARALYGAGRLAFYSGDRGRDCRLLEESTAVMREVGDEDGLAQCLAYLGVAAGVAGDADTARAAGEEAAALGSTSGGAWTRALALWGLGTNELLGRCGPADTDAARPLLEESAALFRTTGDSWALAGPLLYLGRIEYLSADLDSARRLLSETVVLLQDVGDRFRLNLALHGLGDVAGARDDGPGAEAFYTEALEVSRDMGRTEPIADAHMKLALTALGRGDAMEARAHLGASLDGYRECENPAGTLWVLEGYALVAAQSGDRQRAAVLLGASEGRHRGGGVQLDPTGRERLEAGLRDQFGRERFEAARAEGSAMTLEDSVAYALSGGIDP